jgi:hypothetical protein
MVKKEYFWRDIKSFHDLKDMLDIETVASLLGPSFCMMS